ncbi:MAG: hypothetical protein RMH75_04825 [Archaeoglobaceae archaeon]|nr:hypothetical protein [Archaeoglobaceae archaeon]MDW7989970.1 hypothetical protein [Archaeoglobaceae archaeon]
MQRFFVPAEILAIETIFCAIVFLISFFIYYKIHELYRLTEYRGFHYFSNTLLFLGLAYFLRFLVFIFFYGQSDFLFENARLDFRELMIFSVAFMTYSSSASVLYLIYSLSWKWSELLRNEILLHILALIFAVFSILGRPFLLLMIQITLLIVLLIVIVFSYKKYEPERRATVVRVYPLYALLFVFWILNLFLSFRIIPFEFRFFIYALSIFVLGIIAYRVLKKI